METSQRFLRTNSLERGTRFESDNLINTARYLANGARDRMLSWYYLLILSHTGFRLVPKSVTSNDTERRNDRRRALSLR